MKRIATLLSSIFIVTSVFSQDFYLRDAVLIEKKNNTAVVKTSGVHEKKKESVLMAVKSAFDTYFYVGIAGLNDGKPLLDESQKTNYSDYMESFFDEGRYSVFVKLSTEIGKPEKLITKEYKSIVNLEFYDESLYKDLLRNKLIKPKASEMSMEETQNKISLPSIMVVPYKKVGNTFKSILANDFDTRMAIGKVQDGFRGKGVETVDLEGKVDAALRSLEFESEDADAFDSQLIKNSGADVYVTVDMMKDINSDGNRVALSMKAYDTATGRVLSSKQGTSNRFRTSAMDQLCVYAVADVLDSFLKDISASMANKTEKGNAVALRVSIAGSSYSSLDDEVGTAELGLSDLIRSWIRKNAKDNRFHLQGKTSTTMIFDEVKIPNFDAAGEPFDISDFASKLTHYLKKLGVVAENRIDGSTIYLTIQ